MIPIVVLTARPEPEIEAQARATGAADFLHKPIDRESLMALIERVLPQD